MYRKNMRVSDPDTIPSFWRLFLKNLGESLYECRYLIRFVALALGLFCTIIAVAKMPDPPKTCQMSYSYGKLALHVKGSDNWIFAIDAGPNAVDAVLDVAKKLNCPVVP